MRPTRWISTGRVAAWWLACLVAGAAGGVAAAPLHPSPAGERLAATLAADQARLRAQGLDAPVVRAAGRLPDRVLVLLVDFADRPGQSTITPETVSAAWFGETGSVREFYRQSSFSRLQIEGTVSRWLRLPQAHDFYVDAAREGAGVRGTYPRNARRMVEDAVRVADSEIDFRSFDNDGPDGVPASGDDDGFIDALVVVHAGAAAERGDATLIVSHNWTTTAPVETAEGVRAWHYATVAETSPLGTCAHEFGHQLGLPDLYQSGSSFGLGGGLGNWSLMAAGAWLGDGHEPADLDAPSKLDLGFVDPLVPDTNTLGLFLNAAAPNAPGTIYKVWTHGRPDIEYFVIENRQPRGVDARLPGGGMLVYHVDRRAWNNDDPARPRVALLQADGLEEIERRINNGDSEDPYPGRSSVIDAASNPSTRARDGTRTEVRIAGMGAPTATMQFDLQVDAAPFIEVVRQRVHELQGDGDRIAEAGERVGVDLTFRNAGTIASPFSVRMAPFTRLGTQWLVDTGGTAFLPERDTVLVRFSLQAGDDLGDPVTLPIVAVFTSETWTDSLTRLVGLGEKTGFQACLEPTPSRYTRDCTDPELPWSVDVLGRYGAWTFEQRPGDLTQVARSAAGPRYANDADVALVSPPFQVTAGSVLRLLHATDLETSADGRAHDGGRVEIAINGGAWEVLEPAGGYPYRVAPSRLPAFTGAGVFSGRVQRRWDQFALGERAGVARVRFRFVSDDSIAAAGWEVGRVDVVPAGIPDNSAVRLELAVDPNPVRLPARVAFRITASLTAAPRATTLVLFDARGRFVRRIEHVASPATVGVFEWDGTGADGRPVASGLYFARLDWGGTQVGAKLVVLR